MSGVGGVVPLALVGAFVAGALVGAGLWMRYQPGFQAWRERPRVSRATRRLRRLRCRASAALEAAYAGQAREASWWARRALRVDPRHPLALAAMGHACKGRHRWLEATAYFERALHRAHSVGDAGLPDHFRAEVSSELAAVHALAAGEAATVQGRDAHHQKAFQWLRFALAEEPGLRETLRRDPAFAGLRDELEGVAWSPTGFQVTT